MQQTIARFIEYMYEHVRAQVQLFTLYVYVYTKSGL